jgi:capsular exopolysaccharide synthesis family protein
MSQKKQYQAYGYVRVEPTTATFRGDVEALPQYRQFMYSEVKLLESEEMAGLAMQQPVWKEKVGEAWAPAAFAYSTEAKYSNEDSYLHIYFRNEDPRVAEAGATALVNAYSDLFRQRKAETENLTIAALQERVAQTEKAIEGLQQRVIEQSNQYGGVDDLQNKRNKLEESQGRLNQELHDISRALEFANARRASVQADAPLAMTELALGSPDLAQRLVEHEALKQERARLLTLTGAGQNHKDMLRLNRMIETDALAIEQLAQHVRQSYFGEIPNPQSTGPATIPLTLGYIASLEQQKANREQDLRRIDEELAQVSRDGRALADLREALEVKRSELVVSQQQLDIETRNSEFQAQMATIKTSLPAENSAGISQDKRRVMALGGAIIGFAIPVALIVLLGLLDSRFRYSEDAAEAGERATLLGILPNLPDRLSDPAQASIAAHCVHQIRTILQINHGSDQSRAFAVTSASRGDGKTSLALALGLSYAASGARTLLIDTDLQHGGLSARLGVTGNEGIMDALTGGELMRFVCETDVTDLAILPIGRAAGNHAGAFSPGAVRHMLDQAKRHFDVIICDAGPILGSIEATPIAAAVDGVVLAVSRGQSRPLVGKALGHLDSVGATVAGLVFNRAQASDFERSVSGMNLRNGSTRINGGRGTLTAGSVLGQN